MLESIRYRISPILKHKIIWYAAIGILGFDIALTAVYANILTNPVALNETVGIADEIKASIIPGG